MTSKNNYRFKSTNEFYTNDSVLNSSPLPRSPHLSPNFRGSSAQPPLNRSPIRTISTSESTNTSIFQENNIPSNITFNNNANVSTKIPFSQYENKMGAGDLTNNKQRFASYNSLSFDYSSMSSSSASQQNLTRQQTITSHTSNQIPINFLNMNTINHHHHNNNNNNNNNSNKNALRRLSSNTVMMSSESNTNLLLSTGSAVAATNHHNHLYHHFYNHHQMQQQQQQQHNQFINPFYSNLGLSAMPLSLHASTSTLNSFTGTSRNKIYIYTEFYLVMFQRCEVIT
jgi:hypothetical protein